MRAVFVPPETNDGSAFMHHVVMIWTVGQQTYGSGQTLALDRRWRGIRLVRP